MQKNGLAGLASCVGVLFAVSLTACSDSPSDPLPDPLPSVDPVRIVIRNGDAQVGSAGTALPNPPVVLVTGEGNVPAPGVQVAFRVITGGGSVTAARARTDRSGVATPGKWVLGLAPGANTMEASVEGLEPVTFTATGRSPFNITVRYIGTITDAQREAVENAVNRWTNIVVNDVFDLRVVVEAGMCFPQQPAVDEIVDDLLLFVRFPSIDGPGAILGRAGPCFVRTLNLMPVIGLIELDADDLVEIEAKGALTDVIMHEMAHTLGFGTIWPMRSLVAGMGSNDPRYTGPFGLGRYRRMGGLSSGVPVENLGSAGTRDAHWRESIFGNELMTGFLSQGQNPLSAFSVSSLEDLGYRVNVDGADEFSIGTALSLPGAPGTIQLEGREELIIPRL